LRSPDKSERMVLSFLPLQNDAFLAFVKSLAAGVRAGQGARGGQGEIHFKSKTGWKTLRPKFVTFSRVGTTYGPL